MKKFFRLIKREFSIIKSSPVILIIFVGGPLLYSLIIGSVYKNATLSELPIVVVDLDNTPLSNNVIDALEDNQYIKIAKVEHRLYSLTNEVIKNGYQAVVTIPDGFEGDIQQVRHPIVDVDINGSNMLPANYVSSGIQQVLGTLNAGIEIESLKKKGIPAPIAEAKFESFRLNVTRFFNPSNNYLIFFFPGILGTVMQQVFLIALALSFSREFETGSFKNLLLETRSVFHMIFTKALLYWILGMILWMPLLHIMFPAFKIPMVSSWAWVWLLSGLFMISLTFMGMAVSIVLKTQLLATEVLMIIAAPSFIVSGQTWPLEQMPEVVQWIAKCIPLTHFLEAFRRMVMADITLDMIMPQITALLILTFVYLFIAAVALTIKEKKYIKIYAEDEQNVLKLKIWKLKRRKKEDNKDS